MEKYLYHICKLDDWLKAKKDRQYFGKPTDVRRGYIPMSYQDQIQGVIDGKFNKNKDLVLITVDYDAALKHLKMIKKNTRPTPYFFGVLGYGEILSVSKLKSNSKGSPVLPAHLTI